MLQSLYPREKPQVSQNLKMPVIIWSFKREKKFLSLLGIEPRFIRRLVSILVIGMTVQSLHLMPWRVERLMTSFRIPYKQHLETVFLVSLFLYVVGNEKVKYG
jgi:hypothetical protein